MRLDDYAHDVLDRLGDSITQWSDWWASLPQWSLPDWESRHYVTISIVVFIFWPVVVTLLMALSAASTWLFWLVTSALFGLVQLIYVTYQFIMISADIMGLSMLKTFAVIRSQIRQITMKSSRAQRRSRRREWRRRLDEAGNYDNYLKIPIEPKTIDSKKKAVPNSLSKRRSFWWSSSLQHSSPLHEASAEPKRSPLRRSLSFGNLDTSPLKGLVRNSSFSRKNGANDEGQEKTLLSEVVEDELGMTGGMLLTTTERLREARMQASTGKDDGKSIKYLLSGVVKRNHLTLDDVLIENARSIAESGQYGLSHESRRAINGFFEEVEKSLDWVAESSLETGEKSSSLFLNPDESAPDMDSSLMDEGSVQQRISEISDRITLVRKMKQNMGRTALMLSGGGAQAMYHLGVIRALLESGKYNDITVISGTSGGSISAAMCAIKTPEELLRDVCVSHVSTDYLLNGKMKKHNIRWFPSNMEMGAYWLKHRLLVDSADFKRCCDFYYSDFTFAEAFKRTGKHVCITVSAGRAQGVQRLLLNHISTPHVTISSAVAASCALPGVMAPTKLLAKDGNGNQEPFEVDGVEWIDGSVQADLPFQRISTLFNVSNFVVSQTNFHVIPLLNKAHHPTKKSFYWRLFQTWEWDIRNRALKLSRLGLFPKIFGVDITKVFKQKYHGKITFVPRLTTMQTFGLQALANPTVKDMEGYLKYGQIAVWPYLNVLEDMLRLEHALDDCLRRLEERCKSLTPETEGSLYDDVDSIVSSLHASSISNRVRFIGSGREAERLKHKVISLERENMSLRRQLEEMQKQLAENGTGNQSTESPKQSGNLKDRGPSSGRQTRRVSEKEVWSQVRRLRQEAVV